MTGAPGLATVGETMAVLSGPRPGRLRHAPHLELGIGGAESNVAIGVRRLGGSASWAGRVGADELGELVVGRIRAEGVHVHAVRDAERPTSLLLKERRTGDLTRVTYYRADGPGARLTPDDLDLAAIGRAGVLHVTGITAALSPSALATVETAVEHARGAGVPVSLDVNYRAALWDPARAATVLAHLVRSADLVFASDDEAALLGARGTPGEVARAVARLGPREVVVKLGERGALALVDGELHRSVPVPVPVVDPVGAGDAFVAGYLAEVLAGAPAADRLHTAGVCGALAVSVVGDWEGAPTRDELAFPGSGPGRVDR